MSRETVRRLGADELTGVKGGILVATGDTNCNCVGNLTLQGNSTYPSVPYQPPPIVRVG